MKHDKVVCTRCVWHGMDNERLTAQNPFSSGNTIFGCPECKQVNCFVTACDESDCWEPVVCGTPTTSGYRHTCKDHKPKPLNL